MFALAYGQTPKYSFVTTVVYTPKPGIFSALFGLRFSSYEKSQIDYWMKSVGEGAFNVLSVQESSDDPHILTYTVGSNNQALTTSAIERIKPMAVKYSDIWYNIKTTTVEALTDVTRAAGEIAKPLISSMWPYLLAGSIIIIGGVYIINKSKYGFNIKG